MLEEYDRPAFKTDFILTMRMHYSCKWRNGLCSCIDFYQRQGFAVSGLHMTYGQPAAQHEATAATAIAHHYRIPLTFVQLVGGRPKTDGEILGA